MTSTIDNQIDRIRTKLNEADIAIGPPLSEAEIMEFENRNGVGLPEEYRRYLLEIGNECVGPPCYGLVPFGSTPDDMPAGLHIHWTSLPDVRKSFPFTRHWIWGDGGVSTEGAEDEVRNGTICLGTDGCGGDWFLVVTGPDRGIPWMVAFEGIQPICPKRNFLQWFEDWLDGKGPFYGFPGDESHLFPDISGKVGSRTICEEIGQVLWERWDPLNLNSNAQKSGAYRMVADSVYHLITGVAADIMIVELLRSYELSDARANPSNDGKLAVVVAALRQIPPRRR